VKGILFSPIHCPLKPIIICWKCHKKNLMSSHQLFLRVQRDTIFFLITHKYVLSTHRTLFSNLFLTGEGNPFFSHPLSLKAHYNMLKMSQKKILWALINCFWAIKEIKFVLLIAHKYVLSAHRTLFSNLFLTREGNPFFSHPLSFKTYYNMLKISQKKSHERS
jgi:hypothetical protein